MTWWSSKN